MADKIEELWVAEISWVIKVSWFVYLEFGDFGVCLENFGLIGCVGLGLIASWCKIEEFWVGGVMGWLIRMRSSGWLKYLGW